MGDERAVEAGAPAGSAMKWAKSITPWPAAVKLPSAARSLAWAMASAVAEGVGGRLDQAAALGGVRPLEEVGGVEHDAEARARHLVEEPPGGRRRRRRRWRARARCRGRRRSARRWRPPASISARRSRQAAGAALSGCQRHWSSGSRVPVQSVMSRVPMRRAGGGEDGEPAQARRAHRRVGVDHVVGAGDARRWRRRSLRGGGGDRRGDAGGDRVRHRGEAEAGEVELRRGVAGAARRPPASAARAGACRRSWRRCRAASDRPRRRRRARPARRSRPSARSPPCRAPRRCRPRGRRRPSARRRGSTSAKPSSWRR